MRASALLATLAFVAFAGNATAQARGTVAFTNVNVIPMDRERVLENQTVIVRDGRIATVGPAASTQVPQGATRVEGNGRYLVPGIAEVHGHVPGVGNAGPQFAEDVLFLYVAAGATTVRGMQGHPTQLELRRRIEAGELIGPRLVLSGPPLSGNNATDAAAGERLVRAHKEQGFDLLKVHEQIPIDAYDAIVRTAKSLNMQFGGHVSDIVGLRKAIASGQTTVDHLDNFAAELRSDMTGPISQANIDESKIDELVRAARENNVAVVPTMALWEVILGVHDPAPLAARPEMRWMPHQMVTNWVNQTNQTRANPNVNKENARYEVELRRRILGALQRGGVMILMGTDAPQRFSVPGFSLDRELPIMVASGMTPFQVLESGTTNVAKHLGFSDSGRIAPGQRADLILVDGNPLQDITNLTRRAGVMVNGRWLSREELDRRLAEIASRYAG